MRRSCTVEPITRTPSRTSGDSDAVGSGENKKKKKKKVKREEEKRRKRKEERKTEYYSMQEAREAREE